MNELPNIERASENNFLWPSIADAVDTFLRRREHADAFERIWRLIHIWESVVTTFCGAVAARLRQADTDTNGLFLKVREHLYGVSFDKIDKRLKASQGAFDGINDRRIDILRVIQKSDVVPGEFLSRLKQFLDWPETCTGELPTESDENNRKTVRRALAALLDMWKRVCDVPSDAEYAETFKVMNLISAVNTFRNRYAHVPFPYDPIAPLAEGLEQLTDCLFAI